MHKVRSRWGPFCWRHVAHSIMYQPTMKFIQYSWWLCLSADIMIQWLSGHLHVPVLSHFNKGFTYYNINFKFDIPIYKSLNIAIMWLIWSNAFIREISQESWNWAWGVCMWKRIKCMNQAMWSNVDTPLTLPNYSGLKVNQHYFHGLLSYECTTLVMLTKLLLWECFFVIFGKMQ